MEDKRKVLFLHHVLRVINKHFYALILISKDARAMKIIMFSSLERDSSVQKTRCTCLLKMFFIVCLLCCGGLLLFLLLQKKKVRNREKKEEEKKKKRKKKKK